jgi:hypothetical protein
MRLPVALIALAGFISSAEAADVLTSRYTAARTGVNAAERVLTPANVNSGTFGKLWTLYADGQIVAQPLYVSGLAVDTSTNPAAPRVQGTFNAVLVATMHNTVYLYDADRERPGPEGRNVPLWATWLGPPRRGDADIDMFFTNDPEWGILSTPVIDPSKSIVYVVAWHDDGGAQNYRYRLHALRLKDGASPAAWSTSRSAATAAAGCCWPTTPRRWHAAPCGPPPRPAPTAASGRPGKRRRSTPTVRSI